MIKNIPLVLILISFCVCVHSGVVIEGNTTKSEAQKSSSCYCSGINQVCIDNWCYCATNYKKNAYGNCVYKGCTYTIDCEVTQDSNRHCFGSSCVCDNGYYEDWSNGRKCTAPPATRNCDDCSSYENKVCIDDLCYCKADYKKQDNSLTSWSCIYQGCSTDGDCLKNQDFDRHCSDEGSCVCDSGYYEDSDNGYKCTYDTDSYDTTTDVNVWGWLWLVFVAPVALIFVFICIRHRRVQVTHPHLQQHVVQHPSIPLPCSVEQPPPYTTACPKGHQPPITYQRY